MDYLDRDAVLEAVLNLPTKMDDQGYGWLGRRGVWQMLCDFPSSDVVPVGCGKWFSVTEQLPEENGRYLTVMHRTVDPQYRNELGDDDTEVRITRYYQGEWKVPLHSPEWINEAITDIVTHWMPLPEPPKDGET